MKKIVAVDLFCGAGGTSSGILKAAGRRPIHLTAVNHWRTAINTHSLNHPGVHHLCEPVENIHPLDLVKSRHLDLLAASCECRYHSNARGGGVCNEQSRSQAWQLIRWMTDLDITCLLMENVREFLQWGPLNQRTKKPIKSRKGEFFRAFLQTVASLGYQVEWKVQSAADFGDPTSRERFILMARKGGKVEWPEPSHGPDRENPWRVAREIIDHNLKGKSLADRKKPLCANSVDRMEAGVRKFWGKYAEPFLVVLNGTSRKHLSRSARSLDDPLPTVTCSNHITLVEPFIMHLTHQGDHARRCHSIDKPLPTVTGAHRGEMCLIEPFIIQTDQTGGNGLCIQSLDEPLKTVVTKQNMLLIEPFIVKYYGKGFGAYPLSEPLATVTTRDRFMLIEPVTGKEAGEIGIRTRMLQPHELAAAHSFPGHYKFTGNKADQTKQIGNSVPVELAAAHARALLS